jgi:hypothetical protein
MQLEDVGEHALRHGPAARAIRVARQLDRFPDRSTHLPGCDGTDEERFRGMDPGGLQDGHERPEQWPEFAAVDDGVDRAMLQGELGGAGWCGVPDGLLVDARSDKGNSRMGLREDDVRQAGEGGEHPTHGRVRQDRDQGDAALAQPGCRHRRLSHLEEGHHAFLDARAPGRGDHDRRAVFAPRDVEGA